jgi:membrane fusion protein (multidrug efflux system)
MLKKLSTRTKVYLFLGFCAILVIGVVVLNSTSKTAAANSKTDPAKAKNDGKDIVPVELAAVKRGEMSSFVTASTNLRAQREVDVVSQTEGIARQLVVEEGDFVQAGAVLCVLDDTQLQIRLQSARQKLAQARLQSEKANIQQEKTVVQIANQQEELNRYQELYQNQLVSERDVAQIRYRLAELEHDARVSVSQSRELTHRVAELEAELEQVSLEISRCHIKAPFSGYIVQRQVELGRTVRNLEPLFKLSAFSPLYADVFLSESEARAVVSGQAASIRLGVDDTARAEGRVARVSPVVDQASGTVKVTVEQRQAEKGFKPGAFVMVQIQTARRSDALLIPKRALLDEDGEKYVFVVRGDTAHRMPVRLGSETDGQVEVRQGLQEDQQVVVAGQGGLKDGGKIKIVQAKGKNGQNQLAQLHN